MERLTANQAKALRDEFHSYNDIENRELYTYLYFNENNHIDYQ